LEFWQQANGVTAARNPTELKEFCAEIASECAIPEINFNKDSIANHVKTFFSEQRRYKKNKSPSTKVCVNTTCMA